MYRDGNAYYIGDKYQIAVGMRLIGAVLLWSSRNLSEILEPYLVMLNSLPKSALAPILIVWLGSNIRTIIVASISVAVFGSILTLHNGFSSMDPDQIKLIRSLGGNRIHILTEYFQRMGILQPGGDISGQDLEFFKGLLSLIDAYFGKKEEADR